ncbi:MAG: YiiD C-terminal domain-containing protein [Anaeromyxobacter sp.]
MTLDEISAFVHERIPLTRTLAARAVHWDGTTLRLAAPLAPNVNHRGTGFGGSLSAVAILSGWLLLHLRLREAGIAARLVIQRSAFDYDAPVDGDFTATATAPEPGAWERFVETLGRHRAARVKVLSVVACASGEGGRHEGTFVATRVEQAGSPGGAAPG